MMNRYDVLDRYKELLYNIEGIEESMVPIYAAELARRHVAGWAIPISTYRRNRDLLVYKSSLDRNSPYYIDLLKIEDRNDLKVVLKDLCFTMKIKKGL